MLKRDEIEQPNSCLNKAAADEPVFVLRAKDPLAAQTVERWADYAEGTGQHEAAKIIEARHLASEMRDWYHANIASNRAGVQAEAANKFEG